MPCWQEIMRREILKNNRFYCDHIGEWPLDRQEVDAFTVKSASGMGLVYYLQELAFDDEKVGNMRTYLVKDNRTSQVVAYFALKAGMVSLNEKETRDGVVFDTYPGIELANFAVNQSFLEKHQGLKGLGYVVFTDFIKPVAKEVAEKIGASILFIYALPEPRLLERYSEYGFTRLSKEEEVALHNRIRPRYDDSCIFMYQLI